MGATILEGGRGYGTGGATRPGTLPNGNGGMRWGRGGWVGDRPGMGPGMGGGVGGVEWYRGSGEFATDGAFGMRNRGWVGEVGK